MIALSWALTAIVAAGLTLPSTICFAEGKIGNAVTIKNQVEGVTSAGTQPITTGSEVYSNELVRTGGQSMAQLLFLDNTNLSVGPLSTIRLDKFVYDPNAAKGNVVLRLGGSASACYGQSDRDDDFRAVVLARSSQRGFVYRFQRPGSPTWNREPADR